MLYRNQNSSRIHQKKNTSPCSLHPFAFTTVAKHLWATLTVHPTSLPGPRLRRSYWHRSWGTSAGPAKMKGKPWKSRVTGPTYIYIYTYPIFNGFFLKKSFEPILGAIHIWLNRTVRKLEYNIWVCSLQRMILVCPSYIYICIYLSI